ncbi:FAD-dependent oxidoreductase domain-containing protein 1-like [Pomacea canaliculata]|uniref:FAD-dependent oxidoreductase domain-containing protein 1-like n=1 Tax=Pomacea canaliculata TaxID=400727 RepID=UPI000D726ABB|nr:FAD-dependent oxidoreductase domain-containing protein 1-like [Pomacea canaliculata]
MDIKMVRLISQWHSTFKSQNPLQRILRLHKACQRFCTSSKLTLRHAGGDSDESNSDRIPEAGRYRSPWTILKEEFKGIAQGQLAEDALTAPRETDFLIVGGGAIGSSVAYWLKQRNPKGISVTVVERDPSYGRSSTMLSVGGIRHQFSVEENVQLSMFATEFLRNIKEHLSVLDETPPDVQFNHGGCLFLVPARSAPLLEKNVQMQRKLGAKIDLLTKEQLSAKFPWLNTAGIEIGSYGVEGEGWFDPWLLVKALKQKNISLGVKYVTGDVEEFEYTNVTINPADGKYHNTLTNAVIRTREGKLHTTKFAAVVNCAGPWAAELARKAGIGIEKQDDLMIPLPVEPRKRFVYVIHCPDGPSLDMPLTIDPTGVYCRREGFSGHYICGASPAGKEEPSIEDLNVDYDFFNNHIKPTLGHRIPALEALKLKGAWAGFYDYNYVDQNLIIGNHPYHRNFFFANGLGGHGLQHSIGVGRAIMELIIDGEYKTIDLTRFEFDRFLTDELVNEESFM